MFSNFICSNILLTVVSSPRVSRCYLIFVGLCAPLCAFAEDKTIYNLDEIMVTATRTEQAVEDAPGSVDVITRKEIEKKHAITAIDVLNTTAGIATNPPTGKGLLDSMGGSITIRGVPSGARSLILVDGMPVNDSYSGSVIWHQVEPMDMERIEVVKGPFSSLYGGNAMSGVVNILTRMPEKWEATIKTGYDSSFDRDTGPRDVVTSYVSAGGKFADKLSVFASYGYKHTNGYPTDLVLTTSKPTAGLTGYSDMSATSASGSRRYLIGDKGATSHRHDNLNVKAVYDLSSNSKVSFGMMRFVDEWKYGEPDSYLQDASGNPVWSYGTSVKESSFLSNAGQVARNLYNLGLETDVADTKIKLLLGYLDQNNYWWVQPDTGATINGGPGKYSQAPTDTYIADLQLTTLLFNKHLLTYGASFKTAWTDVTEQPLSNWQDRNTPSRGVTYEAKGRDKNFGVFFQDEIQLHEKLTAFVGVRGDWWETYDGYIAQSGVDGYPKSYDSRSKSAFSPKGALVYKPSEITTLRASVGRAFRAPGLYDLYRTTTYQGGVTYAGNPDLKPETITSWDIGIEQKLWEGATVKVSYFENYLQDIIYSTNTTATLIDKVNAGKAENKGVELEAEQRFDKWLRLFTNLTLTDSKITENDARPASIGKHLTYVPDVMVNLGGDYEKGPFIASLVGRYRSKQYTTDDNTDTTSGVYGVYDAYFTADANVSYKATPWAKVSFSVNNIMDKEYYAYSLAPGRFWFADFTLTF